MQNSQNPNEIPDFGGFDFSKPSVPRSQPGVITPPPLPKRASVVEPERQVITPAMDRVEKVLKNPTAGFSVGSRAMSHRPLANILRRTLHTVHPLVSYSVGTYFATNVALLVIGQAVAALHPEFSSKQAFLASSLGTQLLAPYISFGAQIVGMGVTYSRVKMNKYQLSEQILKTKRKYKKPGFIRKGLSAGAGLIKVAFTGSALLAWKGTVASAKLFVEGTRLAASATSDGIVRFEERRQRKKALEGNQKVNASPIPPKPPTVS